METTLSVNTSDISVIGKSRRDPRTVPLCAMHVPDATLIWPSKILTLSLQLFEWLTLAAKPQVRYTYGASVLDIERQRNVLHLMLSRRALSQLLQVLRIRIPS